MGFNTINDVTTLQVLELRISLGKINVRREPCSPIVHYSYCQSKVVYIVKAALAEVCHSLSVAGIKESVVT
jgi:hypothetical protein